jgi:hypothetical protein
MGLPVLNTGSTNKFRQPSKFQYGQSSSGICCSGGDSTESGVRAVAVASSTSAFVVRRTELCAGGEFVMAACFGYSVLADFVEQCLVTDLQQDCGLLAIPICLLKRLRDRGGFRFVFGATC